LLALTEQAIARIHQGLEVEAALHELAAALRELQALRTRDPGVRMAAQDVYEAAAALVIDKRAGAVVTDTRRWRLLKQADWRLRGRLASGDAT
jgi:DNA-binding SARP family transcriptional activator